MPDWFLGLQPAVQAALITGAVGLLDAVVTGVSTATNALLKTWLDQQAERAQLERAQSDAYRQYAEPLTAAATALYWRLREIYESPGGGFFLQPGGGATRFEEYKVASTRYRIAALLGWFAALRRELRHFGANPDPAVLPMSNAIIRVESALADGPRWKRSEHGLSLRSGKSRCTNPKFGSSSVAWMQHSRGPCTTPERAAHEPLAQSRPRPSMRQSAS